MKMAKTKLFLYLKKVMPNVKINVANYASVISIEGAIKTAFSATTSLLN